MTEPARVLALSGRPHVLYRMYDAAGALLYVGISVDPGLRITQHEADKPWWADVVRIELAHFTSRTAVVAAEREAIQTEAPLRNVRMNLESVPIDERHTPTRSIRMDEKWDRLGEVYGPRARSALIDQCAAWLLREPDATLPERKPL